MNGDFETAAAIKERQDAARSLAAGPAVGDAELALPTEPISLAYEVSERKVNRAMISVARKTICAKLNDDQFLMYWAICQQKGVDPFSGAYGFPNKEGGIAFGLRIDGMRALASKTGQMLRREVELLLVADGPKKGEVYGAVARIWRKGMDAPVVEEALFSEYKKSGFGWEQYPETMIRKVAESKALRAAFGDALAGIYEPSEIEDRDGGRA